MRGALLLLFSLGVSTTALADGYVAGNRAFVPSMLTEDPFVADEISTTATRIDYLPTHTEPGYREDRIGWEFAKTITSDLSISVEQGWTHLGLAGGKRLNGFDNLEAALKYQLYVNAEHEFLMSVGLAREFGGTGANRIADTTSVTEPQVFFGKGMGDLPESLALLRPFAVTGTVNLQFPDRHDPSSPQLIEAGFAVEYSLRYLEGNVRYLGLPEFVDRLTPIVEVDYTKPVSHAVGTGTIGYVAPGLIYSGDNFDIGAEAIIPTTPAAGNGIGFMTMLHVRLDTLFPDTAGRKLWRGEGR